uniref:PH domain-containing protein n=1 Tax=Varanus komodoensis TaxID=61221 RepID=A0A8D2J7M7_VARKO
MENKSIMEELLVKKSQQKKMVSRSNYKERLFVLTKTSLSYYDYDYGTRKGSIDIKKIRCVEAVHLVEETPPERQYPFQVTAKPLSSSLPHRPMHFAEIKDNEDLLNKYHKGFFSSGKFLCCSQACKAAPGCTVPLLSISIPFSPISRLLLTLEIC